MSGNKGTDDTKAEDLKLLGEDKLKVVIHEPADTRKASFFIGDTNISSKIVGPDDDEIPIDDIIVAPDGGWGWVIVLASFLSNMVVDGTVFSFGILLGPIHEASGGRIPISSIAWVGSLATGFYFLAGPVVSAIANKYGFRIVAISGSILSCLSILGAWFLCLKGPDMVALYLLYGVIGGVGFGMIYVPAVIAVGFYFEKKRALATGIAICGSGVGTFLFPPIITVIMEQYGWQGALFFEAMIILSCAFFGLLYRPLKPVKRKLEDPRKSIVSSIASPEGTPLLMRIKRARDMDMARWDSTASFNSIAQQDPTSEPKAKSDRLYQSVRKASTHSLSGALGVTVNSINAHHRRISVPSMLASGGDVTPSGAALALPFPVGAAKGKSFVGLPDLKEIAEEDHASEEASREASQAKENLQNAGKIGEQLPHNKYTFDGNENTNMRNRNNSIYTTRIGNSMLTVDEMTQSRILRVASKVTLNKPLYRDDIFYSGSLLRIPEYANNVMSSAEWSAAACRGPEDLLPDEKPPREPCCCGSVMKKMLDVSLLVSPTFLLLSISGFFTMLGLFVPFIYLTSVAQANLGVDKGSAALLISIMGIANTTGRIICGWVADRPQINVLFLNNASITILGLSTFVVPLLGSYAQFIAFTCVFGLAMACFASLRSILLVELLGLEKLTNAFGLMLLFQGFAAILGTPLAGFLFEATLSYKIPFFVAGGFLLLSGVMCYPLNCVKNREQEKLKKLKRKSKKPRGNCDKS